MASRDIPAGFGQRQMDKVVFDEYFSRLNAILESVGSEHRMAYLEGLLNSAKEDSKVSLPVFMALSFYVQLWLFRYPPS